MIVNSGFKIIPFPMMKLLSGSVIELSVSIVSPMGMADIQGYWLMSLSAISSICPYFHGEVQTW